MRKSVLFLLALVLFSFVSAETGLEGVGQQIEDVREIVDKEKYNYLADEWKELLLKNEQISKVNGFFESINGVFVFLFAQDYSFSLEMFFVFLVWVLFLFSLRNYTSLVSFDSSNFEWTRSSFFSGVLAFAIVVILAHIKLFSVISVLLIKLLFYSSSPVWNVVSGVIILFGSVVFIYLNSYFGKKIKAIKERKKDKNLTNKVQNQQFFIDNVVKGNS